MFQENENISVKSESVDVQKVNQIIKMNPFKSAANPILTGNSNSDNSENSLMRENSMETMTMFKESQNTVDETPTQNDEIQHIDIKASEDNPVPSNHLMSPSDVKIENSPVGENSTSEAPKAEKRLYEKINKRRKNFCTDSRKRVLRLWYDIGEDIHSFYEGNYGEKEIERISANTGIGKSTLYKAIKFASNFTNDDFQGLLKKDYISFRLVVESFPIGRPQALQVFESSNSAREAKQKIDEIKGREPVQDASGCTTNIQTKPDNDEIESAENPDAAPESPESINQSRSTSESEPDSSSNPNDEPDEKPVKPNQQAETNKKSAKAELKAAVNNLLGGVYLGMKPLTNNGNSMTDVYESVMEVGIRLVNASTDKIALEKLSDIVRGVVADLSIILSFLYEGSNASNTINQQEEGKWASTSPSAVLPT